MANTQEKHALEAARARLEQALSRLTQDVASSRSALEVALADGASAGAEQTAQSKRLQTLEQENLRLHEQIAAISLQAPSDDGSGDDGDKIAAIEAEKAALQQNYELLKRQYTSLQDEFEGLQDRMGGENDNAGDETGALRRQIGELVRERDSMRGELDGAIAELENYLADNKTAAGGIN